MGKRKQTAPRQCLEEKRRHLQWNMLDSTAYNSGRVNGYAESLFIIDDDDVHLEDEGLTANTAACNSRPHFADLNSQESIDTAVDPKVTESTHTLSTLFQDQTFSVSENTINFFKDIRVQQLFEDYLDQCVICLTLHNKMDVNVDWFFEIGRIYLKIQPHPGIPENLLQLPHCSQCWLYVSENQGRHMMYFELGLKNDLNLINYRHKHKHSQNVLRMFWCVDISVPIPSEFLHGLNSKVFQLVLGEYDTTKQEQEVLIFGRETALISLAHPSEAFRPKPVNFCLQKLLLYFYKIGPQYDLSGLTRCKRHDFHELYEAVMEIQRVRNVAVDVEVQHQSLIPKLRPYQREAVRWMLHREHFSSSYTESDSTDELHPLYNELKTFCGKILYYNKHGGSLIKERPKRIMMPTGGILADEMGLGKTVEVLCCMLLHPRSSIPQPARLPTLMETQFKSEDIEYQQNYKQQPVLKRSEENEDVGLDDCFPQPVDWEQETIPPSVTVSDHIYCQDTETREPDIRANSPSKRCRVRQRYKTKKESILEQNSILVTNSLADVQNVDFAPHEQNIGCSLIPVIQNESKVESLLEPLVKNSENSNSLNTLSNHIIGSLEDFPEDNNSLRKNKKDKDVLASISLSDATCNKRGQKDSKYISLIPETDHNYSDHFSKCSIPQKRLFECVCGKKEIAVNSEHSRRRSKKMKHIVECIDCGMSQHAECLNYDLNDPFRGGYKCPHCHVASTPIPSGATLIISPFQIYQQWVDEISKHIKEKALNVFVYTGVNKQGFIQPQTLASQDIVVTTYETLRKELDYVDLPHTNSENGRRFRHPKRFMAIPSPIIAVEWWRICLDEAQMVECVTTKTAEMALRLSAVNRWCVTGTPLTRSVEDIYGLLLFLGIDPYWVQQWWKVLLWEPFCHGIKEPLYTALAQILWRTAKKDVINQIGIPEQTEEVCWLTFSPVEDHFYRRLYHKCCSEAMRNLSGRTDISTKLNTLDRRTVATLLRPLLNLRQACCHPQAVRGAFIPIHESMMTMEELLDSLIKKAALECEEAHRQVVAALNGLAALHIIAQQPVEAVELYREVMRSVEEHKSQLRTDDLQQLHAMFNLQEVLATKPLGVAPTLRDHQLAKQCEELRQKYMTKARAKVTTSREQLAPCQQSVQEIEEELNEGSDWWLEILATSTQKTMDQELVNKVREDLMENTRPELSSSIYRFRDIRGLQYVVQTQLSALETARSCLMTDLQKLDRKAGFTLEVINQTVECCLRPTGPILKNCPFCKVDDLFNKYESKLFSFVDKGIVYDDKEDDMPYQVHTRRQGTWADSELERVLKSLINFARAQRMHPDVVQFGVGHIKVFECWKKEFKLLRGLWMALREEVSAVDELDMATTRLRVRLPDEPRPEIPQPNVLESTELNAHRLKLMTDRTVNLGELRKKLGQLMYLKNLSKSQKDMVEGVNPDPCPVCQKELGQEWSVLQCGHCFCMECIHILVSRFGCGYRSLSLKCPLCREVTHEGEISYVSTRQHGASETSPSVKGSHSTKVAAVVQCLLNIKNTDPNAKALVFSTWTDVLDLIGKALTENSITYTALHTAGKFQQSLSSFKEQNGISVLLLPYHSGANGLNLIEATHALLVEPILNPAQEAQAISRIHRIGQMRCTKVYRFLVQRTIEERIHRLMESALRPAATAVENDVSMEDNSMTIGQLISLFQESLGMTHGSEGMTMVHNNREHDGVGVSTGEAVATTYSSSEERNHALSEFGNNGIIEDEHGGSDEVRNEASSEDGGEAGIVARNEASSDI